MKQNDSLNRLASAKVPEAASAKRARDLMHREVVRVPEAMDVWAVAKLFTERRITGAPVEDAKGRAIGVISQTDILRHLEDIVQRSKHLEDFYSEPEADPATPILTSPTAKELMTPRIIRAGEDATLRVLRQIMLSHRVHRVIIMKGDELRGIVTTMDILKEA